MTFNIMTFLFSITSFITHILPQRSSQIKAFEKILLSMILEGFYEQLLLNLL